MNHKNGEIIIYRSGQGPDLQVKLEKDTIWASLDQIAALFKRDKSVISRHIRNIFKEKELDKNSVVAKTATTAADGKTYQVEYFNLDVIISVGYRVNSKRATAFRIWATRTLRQYLVEGYVLDKKRIAQKYDEFERAVRLIKGVIEKKQLSDREKTGLLKVVTDYADAWIMLQKYDRGELAKPVKTKKPAFSLDYAYAGQAIAAIKTELVRKNEASALFGREREHGLQALLGNLYQTFARRELYPGIEEKAANLLYLIIKDHPFVDGNKRIGSFLFIVFLARNNYLYDKKGEKKFNDNALVALALLIAESKPRDKEILIRLVINLVFG